MHPPIGEVKLAAIRALREGGRPTFTRLAAAADLHPATLRERSSRDSWKKPVFPKRELAAEAALALAPDAGFAEETGADLPEAGQEMGIDELRQRYARVLPRQLGKILALAERGILDKNRVDALISIGRVFERSVELAEQGAAETQKRSDDELAAILQRVNDRIIELARGLAARMVAEQLRSGGSEAGGRLDP